MTSGQELEALERFRTDADVHVDASTNAPKWDGVPMDVAGTQLRSESQDQAAG